MIPEVYFLQNRYFWLYTLILKPEEKIMSAKAAVELGQRVHVIREIKDNFQNVEVGEKGEVIIIYNDAFQIPVRVKFDSGIEQQLRYNEFEVIE